MLLFAAYLYIFTGQSQLPASTTSMTDQSKTDQQAASSSSPKNSNIAAATGLSDQPVVKKTEERSTPVGNSALLHTSMGDISVRFYPADAPKTVANFVKLASTGFYDTVKFHRVIKGFMIQAGDPNSKDDSNPDSWGKGGPGYTIPDEVDASKPIYQKGYKHGILAMARTSMPNSGGSQFFIMAADYPLSPEYTIFGEVTGGLSVVDAIDAVKTSAEDRPLSPVTIESIEIK